MPRTAVLIYHFTSGALVQSWKNFLRGFVAKEGLAYYAIFSLEKMRKSIFECYTYVHTVM